MGRLLWDDFFPHGQEVAMLLESLNRFCWSLSFKRQKNQIHIWSGDKILYVADNEAEFKAFLTGMAISLVVLPVEIQQQIQAFCDDEIDLYEK